MSAPSTAFLVVRREDGFGEVFPLEPSQTVTMGRAVTNRIVLKDDLCSREHAEITFSGERWRVRDLNSLNGTRVNGQPLEREWELAPRDLVHVGRTYYLFVEHIDQLPPLSPPPDEPTGVAIKKRLGQTRYLTPLPADTSPTTTPVVRGEENGDTTVPGFQKHNVSRDLSLLYRLALAMGTAETEEDLCHLVLEGLFEATTAEVGAILKIRGGAEREAETARPGTGRRPAPELEVVSQRYRDLNRVGYLRVSEYVTNEVLASREAILAEDVARDRYLRNRESLKDMGATSLICAPVLYNEEPLGLIHLYCSDPHKTLSGDDLEFTVAVAKQLGAALHHLLKQDSLHAEVRSLRDQLRVETELVGTSPVIENLERQIAQVADTNATCLIRGESGSGKELVARAIHYNSHRKDGPFVCLNCAALTETLLESELFGHEKGSFTGATEKKIGKFEAADHGTIFLDEIGEMNVGTQSKLLRILEGHAFERVGGSVPIQVNVRVVAATNQPLEEGVRNNTFRRDLFFRLQVIEIRVPPLREHKADVPILAEHFLRRFARETARKIRSFSPAALRKLEEYHWPGNVRELRNVVERAVALSQGPVLDVADIWLSSLDLGGPAPACQPEYQPVPLEEIEKQHILATLSHTDWNKSQAAAILQIERSTLDRKIKSYDLKR